MLDLLVLSIDDSWLLLQSFLVELLVEVSLMELLLLYLSHKG